MTKTPDFTAMFKDFMDAFPVDAKAFEGAIKNQTELTEKLFAVALTAAEQSSDISSKWTKETLARLNTASKAKTDPADLTKAFTDFASANADVAAENMAAFAEVAKKVQLETVELLMNAGKDAQEETAAAVQKAANDVTQAAAAATAA